MSCGQGWASQHRRARPSFLLLTSLFLAQAPMLVDSRMWWCLRPVEQHICDVKIEQLELKEVVVGRSCSRTA